MAYTCTRVDPQRYSPNGIAGKRVKSRDTHPVAQLVQQDNPVTKPPQATHRPLSPRTHSFHTIYDANGNVTEDATGQRFGYDAENHQKTFFNSSNPGSTPDWTYSYDGDRRRVKKESATEVTVFVYDATGKLVAEYASALAQTQEVSYLTTDHLGSP